MVFDGDRGQQEKYECWKCPEVAPADNLVLQMYNGEQQYSIYQIVNYFLNSIVQVEQFEVDPIQQVGCRYMMFRNARE